MAAVAIALIGVGLQLLPGNAHVFGLVTTIAGGSIGMAVIVWSFYDEVRRRMVAQSLAELLTRADNLRHANLQSQQEYDDWAAELSSWFKETNNYLNDHLSPADAAIFRDASEGLPVAFRCRFDAQNNYLNSLLRYTVNLKRISERFLGRR
jgi:hypothetical protein